MLFDRSVLVHRCGNHTTVSTRGRIKQLVVEMARVVQWEVGVFDQLFATPQSQLDTIRECRTFVADLLVNVRVRSLIERGR